MKKSAWEIEKCRETDRYMLLYYRQHVSWFRTRDEARKRLRQMKLAERVARENGR
jgi:hypothetical protein